MRIGVEGVSSVKKKTKTKIGIVTGSRGLVGQKARGCWNKSEIAVKTEVKCI